MEIKPSKKMSLFQHAIFGDLKKFAKEQEQQKALDLIDLSLGSPDLPPHDLLLKTMSDKALLPSSYGYTLTGSKEFNEAVSRYYQRVNQVEVDSETEIVQTMGSQEGLVHLPIAFCNPGDVVLTTNPGYVAYAAGISLAEATPYYIPLDENNDYLPNLDVIPEEVARQAKMIILNMPGNPVPMPPSIEYFTKVVEFAKKYHILVVHDAAYSEFYFTGDAPISFLAAPGAKEVGIEINSLSKSFSLAGARVAYIVGNPEMVTIMKRLKSNLDFGIFDPIQSTAITALNHAEEITANLRNTFAVRHAALMKGLQEIGWEVAPSHGGMFVWAKYPYSIDSVSFAYKAIEQSGVVMVPGTAFGSGGEGFARLALVQEVSRLTEAVQRLNTIRI